jgi:CRISPR-associated protein Csy1
MSYNNLAIRQHRARLVEQICDEAHQFAARLAQLPSGWSDNTECRLDESERLWLDPNRTINDEEFARQRRQGDWIYEVGRRFANWLNAALSTKTFSLGEDEHSHWRADLLKELSLFQNALEVDRG